MTSSSLIRLQISEAQKAKWELGRAKYGAEWSGCHPLIEGYSEAIDLLNYLDEAIRRAPNAQYLFVLRDDATRLAERIHLMIAGMSL